MSNNSEFDNEKKISCEGGFGIMPHRLRRAENININAKFLFLALIELQHEKGYCYASNKYLASQELNGVSVRSIQNWLNELEENGWIKTEIIRGDKNEVIQRRIYTNLNQNTPINPTVNTPGEKFFMTPHESTFMTPHESTFTYKNNNIEKEEKENIKRKADPMNENPASGSPSSPKVDELRLAEEVFENRFWVLVQNKVGKEQAKQRFFQITNNCKNEKKVNEVIEGYKRYLSFLAKNKANNFNRRPKDPATFLNLKNKLWLEPWEFVEDEVALSAGGSRIKQPKNWQDRIGIAKRLGLLENFEREEINDMYDKEWKFVPNEAKQAIASEKVDVEYKERVEQKRKREIELKEKTLKKREKEVECQNLGEKLKQLEFEIKKPFLSWIEETFDLSSLIKDFKTHMFLKLAVPENVSEFSMLKFYKDELWLSSEIDRMLEEKLGDDKEFVKKKQEYENELMKYDEEFKKHRELVKEIEDYNKPSFRTTKI